MAKILDPALHQGWTPWSGCERCLGSPREQEEEMTSSGVRACLGWILGEICEISPCPPVQAWHR